MCVVRSTWKFDNRTGAIVRFRVRRRTNNKEDPLCGGAKCCGVKLVAGIWDKLVRKSLFIYDYNRIRSI